MVVSFERKRELLGYFVREGGMIGSFEKRRERARDMLEFLERERCYAPLREKWTEREREREVLGSFDRKQRDTKGGMIGSFEESSCELEKEGAREREMLGSFEKRET
ncbi:Amyloid-Beta Precursor Protein, partial [Manis pentadactyla]